MGALAPVNVGSKYHRVSAQFSLELKDEVKIMKKKFIASLLLAILTFITGYAAATDKDDAQQLKEAYSLQKHSEGGWFAELYTSPFKQNDRAPAGSIYFLIDKNEISHFHQIDCDEIWYYHTGCGMKIYIFKDNVMKEYLLGINTEKNEQPMVIIPAGAIFAAENIDRHGYTFISCATTPAFKYEGFRLVSKKELKALYPQAEEHILNMAFDIP